MNFRKSENPRDNGEKKGPAELLGFVVFEAGLRCSEDRIEISFSKTICRLSMLAYNILGNPDYIVAFFDHSSRRMMVKPAAEGMPNIIKLVKVPKSRTTSRRYIQSQSLVNMISTVSGKDIRKTRAILPGHQADVPEPTLIFHLDDIVEVVK